MKHKSRRRLAAVNFLTNVSLDGTYRDTKCASLFNFSAPKCEEPDPPAPGCGVTELVVQFPNANSDLFDIVITEVPGRVTCPSVEHRSPQDERSSSRKRTRTKSFTKKSFESLFRNRHRSNSTSVSTDSYTELSTSLSPRSVICLNSSGLRRERPRRDRIVLVTASRSPFGIFSVLPFHKIAAKTTEPQVDTGARTQLSSSSCEIFESLASLGIVTNAHDEEVSFRHLLNPAKTRRNSATIRRYLTGEDPLEKKLSNAMQVSPIKEDEVMTYDPNQLDDPEFMSGKHRTLMQLASYVTSVIDYVRPEDLKRHLNEQFRERYPQIQLTLSKLRSLKLNLLQVGRKYHIDLWIISQAYVYFEKMILKNLVTKANRKWTCAASLLLAAKMNDIKGTDISQLIQELESTFKVSRRQLLVYELAIMVALEFALSLPLCEVFPHYQRLDKVGPTAA